MKRLSFIKKLGILSSTAIISPKVKEENIVEKVYSPVGKWEENWKWTDERKKMLSERRKGQKHSEETKNKISIKLKGRKKSDEHINNWRKSYKGFKHSELTKLKRSISLKGVGAKPIIQFDLDGNYIREWPSIIIAAKTLNCSHGNIASVANGRQKTAKGFIWKFKVGE